MNRLLSIRGIVASFALWQGVIAVASDRPLPPEARLLDAHFVLKERPYPTISPNGRWVAYASESQISVCNIEKSELCRVMEMPDSFDRSKSRWTDVSWTRSSDGFVFGIESFDEKSRSMFGSGHFATVEGKVSQLSRIEPNSPARGLIVGDFTDDRRCFVGRSTLSLDARRWGPLIWDIERNRPLATPYLYLVPSATSGRWIGIEKDTRQLVLLDESLEVAQRFDQPLSDRTFGFRLDWSPDERFILWRNQIGFDHYSNWEGFRLDLKTRAKRPLEGRFMREQIAFTGNGGEFVRCGQDGERARWSGDRITGSHLTIVPDGKGAPQDVWRIVLGPEQRLGESSPRMHMSPEGKIFAIALPQIAGDRTDFDWHLIDRTGKAWRFPDPDSKEYLSSYDVAGFAQEGELIVRYDAKRIFAVPVASILKEENEVR